MFFYNRNTLKFYKCFNYIFKEKYEKPSCLLIAFHKDVQDFGTSNKTKVIILDTHISTASTV